MVFKLFNLFRRGNAWKKHVEQNLLSLSNQLLRLESHTGDGAQYRTELSRLASEVERLRGRIDRAADTGEIGSTTTDVLAARLSARQDFLNRSLARVFARDVIAPLGEKIHAIKALNDRYEVLLSRRASELLVALLASNDPMRERLAGASPLAILGAALDGAFTTAAVIVPDQTGRQTAHRVDELLAAIERMPSEALSWAEARRPLPTVQPPTSTINDTLSVPANDYFTRLSQALDDLDRLDFHALAQNPVRDAIPFDEPTSLPKFIPAEPRKKSALFLHNNYYHFNCLSEGLRARDWDTLTVSLESPESPQRQFYHGEDLTLFDPDPAIMSRKTREFFSSIPERFGSLHFSGQGLATLFPSSMENTENPGAIPWDFLELRRHQTIIGYMPSGCMDGGLQSSIRELTDICGRCVWELRPDVCSDARSLVWNKKLALLCDWVGLEGDHATPERVGDKTVYGPVVTALDPRRWHSEIEIPEDMKIERVPEEILIYHAVGNYATRRTGGRDIKGTGAIIAAIDKLKAEGLPVRLVFAHDIPSTRVRFLQVQADIVADQLNYGRYGANARESMMLGKPTICHLTPVQSPPLPLLRPILEAPIVDASEASIADVLRRLVLDRNQRIELGRRARAYAVKWHGQDSCAERYEHVIDRIRAGLVPESPDIYPLPEADAVALA